MSDLLFKEIGKIDPSLLQDIDNLNHKYKKRNRVKRLILSTAAALAILITLPNINHHLAFATYEIPILGDFFEIITFRSYEHYIHTEINKEQPIVSTGNEHVDHILNESVETYTNILIDDFKENSEGQLGALNITYEIKTNTEYWFSLAINSTEIGAGSYNRTSIYHINKRTGKISTLEDLFEDTPDYVTSISEDIMTQMESQMKAYDYITYFIGGDQGFNEIKSNQNFYFNSANDLVIMFDEYEVAPGVMGIVEFIISRDIISY